MGLSIVTQLVKGKAKAWVQFWPHIRVPRRSALLTLHSLLPTHHKLIQWDLNLEGFASAICSSLHIVSNSRSPLLCDLLLELDWTHLVSQEPLSMTLGSALSPAVCWSPSQLQGFHRKLTEEQLGPLVQKHTLSKQNIYLTFVPEQKFWIPNRCSVPFEPEETTGCRSLQE